MLTFVETKLFTQLVAQYLSDEDYRRLQHALAANPEAGDVVRGSGGVRKLRWGLAGRGKRGGVRVGRDDSRPLAQANQGGDRWPRLSATSGRRFWTGSLN